MKLIDLFKYSQIYNQESDIFYSLVLFTIAKEGHKVLEDSNKVNRIIEEYANGGFEIIYTILKEKGDDYFGDEANFLQELIDRKETKKAVRNTNRSDKKPKTKINTGDEFDIEL